MQPRLPVTQVKYARYFVRIAGILFRERAFRRIPQIFESEIKTRAAEGEEGDSTRTNLQRARVRSKSARGIFIRDRTVLYLLLFNRSAHETREPSRIKGIRVAPQMRY